MDMLKRGEDAKITDIGVGSNISAELLHSCPHFMNSSLTKPGVFSCAVDSFLEVYRRILFPYLSVQQQSNEFIENCNLCIQSTEELLTGYASLTRSDRSICINQNLAAAREIVWSFLRSKCPSFVHMNCDAIFSDIFRLRTFGELTVEEDFFLISKFSSAGICTKCNREYQKSSSDLVYYITGRELFSIGVPLQQWPLAIEISHKDLLKLHCSGCDTYLSQTSYSFQGGKFLFVEFSSEISNVNFPSENIAILGNQYSLKGLVRCVNAHFTCSVWERDSWLVIDDLLISVKKFQTISDVYRYFPKGWFFAVYRKNNGSDHDYCKPIIHHSLFTDHNYCASQSVTCEINRINPYDTEIKLSNSDCSANSPGAYDNEVKKQSGGNQRKRSSNTNNSSTKRIKVDNVGIKMLPKNVKYNINETPKESNNCTTHQRNKSGSLCKNKNILNFHKAMHMKIYQCSICKEACPYKNKLVGDLCKRCKVDKGNPKKFSAENNMIPCAVPPELTGLTQVEEMLIARAFPIMQVYKKPKGGQRAYKGHVLTLPQDVQQLATVLPRTASEIPVILFSVQTKKSSSKEFRVRRDKVKVALEWLISHNPLYAHVTIDSDRIDGLPVNDYIDLPELHVSEVNRHEDELEDNHVGYDAGPDTYESEMRNMEISSLLPVAADKDIQSKVIRDSLQATIDWQLGEKPLNEFCTPYLATMAFPTLFPNSIGDPTSNENIRDISSRSETESFAAKLKHLIKFAENISGKWTYRFASHPRFAYWAFNLLYRRRLLSQGNIFIKQNPGEASLTSDDFQSMLNQQNSSLLMSKIVHYAKNVTGSNAYWCKMKHELKAIIMQQGPPTIFWTLSCADFHWPEFHSLFSDPSDYHGNVINYPHLLDWLFTERTEKFVKEWLYKCLGAKWHWFRYEFAVQRGSIHCHGVAKLADDPGLCELSKVALRGHLALKFLANNSVADEEEENIRSHITEGLNAEITICNYVDKLMSTVNPEPPSESWVKPSKHPCKEIFSEISDNNFEDDYIHLLNTVQRHTTCSSLYCLKGADGEQNCRFGFPLELCDRTHLEYEKIHSSKGPDRYKIKVVTARNDPRLNRHQRLQLQGWRANCDINVVIDYHSCIEYLAKYASKAEKISSVASDAFSKVISQMKPETSTASILRKLMIRAVGERDMSIQEVMHQIQSLKLHSSSFRVVTVSMNGSRKIKASESQGDIEVEPSVVDNYAERVKFASSVKDIESLNFIQFVSNYCVINDQIHKRKESVVVRVFPSYSSNHKNPDYWLFCKFQLLKYKPWSKCFDNAWGDQNENKEVILEWYSHFLTNPMSQDLLPSWSTEMETLSLYTDLCEDEDSDTFSTDDNRDEWMLLADLSTRSEDHDTSTFDEDSQFWKERVTVFNESQVGDMATWIKCIKSTFNLVFPETIAPDLNSFSIQQKLAYDLVLENFISCNRNQLLLLVTGVAGTGKSYLINALRASLSDSCIVLAFFGIAAFNVHGSTLHSFLKLPVGARRQGDLKGEALSQLQHDMSNIKYIIIDEYSVIGQKMLGWISRRLKQATGKFTEPFGGISIILIGDIGQLPSISDRVVYHSNPSCPVSTEGYCCYKLFEKVVILKQNYRAGGKDKSEFRDLLLNLRDGEVNEKQWELLMSRCSYRHNPNVLKNCVKLSYGNVQTAKYNFDHLTSLGAPIAVINARNSNSKAKSLASDDFGGLEEKLFLCLNARVMLTRNLWTEAGLCNGAMGYIYDIVYAPGTGPPSLPVAVIVQFDSNYIGPSFISDKPRCVPITPVLSTSDSMGPSYERQQIPLKLSWGITIHKSQGLTLNKVHIDFGKTEAVPGLAYVALSRAKSLDDVYIEPVTLERLNSIKKSSTYICRKQEEHRLNELSSLLQQQ